MNTQTGNASHIFTLSIHTYHGSQVDSTHAGSNRDYSPAHIHTLCICNMHSLCFYIKQQQSLTACVQCAGPCAPPTHPVIGLVLRLDLLQSAQKGPVLFHHSLRIPLTLSRVQTAEEKHKNRPLACYSLLWLYSNVKCAHSRRSDEAESG